MITFTYYLDGKQVRTKTYFCKLGEAEERELMEIEDLEFDNCVIT